MTIDAGTIFNWGLSSETNKDYFAMACAASNCWDKALEGLNTQSTNQIERLLLLSIRDKFGPSFYLDFIDKLADMKSKGFVSKKELNWAIRTECAKLSKYFVCNFRDPVVRKVLQKLKSVEPERKYWDRVLSGEAYTNLLQQIDAGLWNDSLLEGRKE